MDGQFACLTRLRSETGKMVRDVVFATRGPRRRTWRYVEQPDGSKRRRLPQISGRSRRLV